MSAVFFSKRKTWISLAQKRHTVNDPSCDHQSPKESYRYVYSKEEHLCNGSNGRYSSFIKKVTLAKLQ